MRHTLPTLALLAAALVAAASGCRPKQAAGAIPRDRFVQANVDMRAVPDTVAGADSLRKAALRKHHVTEADLRRFVDAHARNPEYLSGVWREVSDSLQRRFERTFPSVQERVRQAGGGGAIPGTEPGGIPGVEANPIPGAVVKPPAIERGARQPPNQPLPNQPPPPTTEPPRPMVREAPPVRRPPVGLPPDARGPTTVPVRPPVVQPRDTLD
ncbi:MAG TPA: hypothetical protein VJT67_04540 [Longimicrobiaceae bacterium]|nr:hypothetical protein [Longimicrobiaceae bacterium]